MKFVYVGRVSKEKNLDALLEAFVELRRGGAAAQLAIVGDGPLLPALKDRYRRDDVVFTGFLAGETLAAAYASADAFVFPSTTDTFGNVVLEAQASGLPVIVSNQGGPAETVEHETSGLIFDAAEPGSLKRAMLRLLDDGPLRRRLAAGALANSRNSSWRQVLDHLWRSEPCREAGAETYLRIRNGRAMPRLAAVK